MPRRLLYAFKRPQTPKVSPDIGNFLPDDSLSTPALHSLYQKYSKRFSDNIFTGVSLEWDDAICAQIAKECYVAPRKRSKQFVGFVLDQKHSQAAACIYVDVVKKIAIVGYRGTVFGLIKDIASDVHIVLDIQGIDPRLQEALKIYDLARREYNGFSLYVCGHSLGGTLAYIVAKHRGPERCVVFNPGVSFNTLFIQMLKDTLVHVDWANRTYTYKILWDIVSAIAYVGNVKTFLIHARDPVALHTIDNFVPQKIDDTI